MNDRIVIFDSGVGGLTVFKEFLKVLPNESYYVLADTLNYPYGTKSSKEISNLNIENFKKMEKLGIKAFVIASNTATIHGYEDLKNSTSMPVIGVIEPGIRNAIKSGLENILVMGTDATIESGYIQNELLKHNSNLKVEGLKAQELDIAVEEGFIFTEKGQKLVYKYLDMVKIDPDLVMLSCTHFPVFEEIIIKYYKEKGKDIKIINPANSTALDMKSMLEKEGLLKNSDKGHKIDFLLTKDSDNYIKAGNFILNDFYHIDETKIV